MPSLTPDDVAIAIIAKAPVAGRVKTRLTPAVSDEGAALLAAAALDDTIAAVAAASTSRRILLFDGDVTGFAPADFELIPQRGGGLGDRLSGAFEDIGGPAVIIAMDTPQVRPDQLAEAQGVVADGADVAFGPAADGGYWLIGLAAARGDEFDGVPMSLDTTGELQLKRLAELGLSVAELPRLVDIDTIDDAASTALQFPDLQFSRQFRSLMDTQTPVKIASEVALQSGSLVNLIGPAEAPLLLRGLYAGGDPGPIAAALAQVPELCLPTLPFVGAALSASGVSVRLKEIIILRTSVLLECKYCVNAHSVVAFDTGLSIAETKALRDEEPIGGVFTDTAELALIDFIDAMATGRGALPTAVNEAMKANFTDPEIVEFSVTIGATMFLNRFATGLGLPTDDGTLNRLGELGLQAFGREPKDVA